MRLNKDMPEAGFVKIAWYGLHFGEEPPLVLDKGAGTIFFTGCNLKCVYCQNYQISQKNLGADYSISQLSDIMLSLEKQGALNIDLVSPTIWSSQIKPAIIRARGQCLKLPIIWNSNAYENKDMLANMAGLVDVYLPDFKYGDDGLALKYSGVKNYAAKAKEAIGEMLSQVGNLKLSNNGEAKQGVLVRHLVLPGQTENSLKALDFIKGINANLHVSLMSQYEPVFKAKELPGLDRSLYPEEFEKVFNHLLKLGLDNGYVQELSSHKVFMPDFTKVNPFE